ACAWVATTSAAPAPTSSASATRSPSTRPPPSVPATTHAASPWLFGSSSTSGAAARARTATLRPSARRATTTPPVPARSAIAARGIHVAVVLLPVLAVERVVRERAQIDVVEAAHVDVHLVGIGARHVERRARAHRAEVVTRHHRPEAVLAERRLAAGDAE